MGHGVGAAVGIELVAIGLGSAFGERLGSILIGVGMELVALGLGSALGKRLGSILMKSEWNSLH